MTVILYNLTGDTIQAWVSSRDVCPGSQTAWYSISNGSSESWSRSASNTITIEIAGHQYPLATTGHEKFTARADGIYRGSESVAEVITIGEKHKRALEVEMEKERAAAATANAKRIEAEAACKVAEAEKKAAQAENQLKDMQIQMLQAQLRMQQMQNEARSQNAQQHRTPQQGAVVGSIKDK